MSDKRQSASVAWWMAGMALMLVSLAILCGCTRTVYEPVETVRTEYRDREVTVNDKEKETEKESVRESTEENTTITLNENGDTLRTDRVVKYIRDRSLEKENQRLLLIIDSLQAVKQESIPVPYPVERPLSRWEQAKMDLGGIAMGGVAVAVCFAVIWLIKRFRHNR